MSRGVCVVAAAAWLTGAAVGDIINVPGDYPAIQPAIDAAGEGDEIVVAPGSYFETINFLGKAITLRSSDGAKVTIIDAQGAGSVVTCEIGEGPGTVLEGFTIAGGTGTDPGNGSLRGGGIMNSGASPTVTSCMFLENSAHFGGGIYNNSNSNPVVTNCAFTANSASFGGGMFNFAGSSPSVTGCTFTGNTAAFDGGGIYTSDGDSLTVTNCTFSGNAAGSDGGGISTSFATATVSHCTFVGNTTCCSGGGMHNFNCSTTVTGCTFSGNSANIGGGMRNQWGSTTVTNCTLSRNSANYFGGGMENFVTINVTVTNCILWDNAPDQIVDGLNAENTVRYSDVEGGWLGLGSSNIDADSLFIDPGSGDFRLQPGSPCIDAGHNGAIVGMAGTDLDGNPRFADGPAEDTGCGVPVVVDMGAYEFQGEPFPARIGDIDGDGAVHVTDFLHLLDDWGPCREDCCLSDLDLDGQVGIEDFRALLANWG